MEGWGAGEVGSGGGGALGGFQGAEGAHLDGGVRKGK